MISKAKLDFLMPGATCYCEDDYRCDNHDLEAESAYWGSMYRSERKEVRVDLDAYERGSAKRFALEGEMV